MSTRQGMADGRGYTIQNSSKLVDSFIMSQHKIEPEDNYSLRRYLQQAGPEALSKINELQPAVRETFTGRR
jgi:hypothetical protein